MTSRTPMGVQSRPPQRTLSGSGLSQRPPVQPKRTLSQQYLPASPVVSTQTLPGVVPGTMAQDDITQQQRFTAQTATTATAIRRGGSRLKLELSNEDDCCSQVVESPQNINNAFLPGVVGTISSMSNLSAKHGRPLPGELPPPYPMPGRQAPFMPPPPPQDPPPPSTSSKRDGRLPPPYNLEPPSIAPRFATTNSYMTNRVLEHPGRHRPPSSGFADFFPWTGNHPEDQFNENAIRQGFFEKGTGPAESSGARDKMCPLLKHKTCLQSLSNIFSSVLLQRRQAGIITCRSNFKPPPRATLPDTKREMWLRELANPAVPLRKLSRTIPHGIKGRVLLEQCLNKKIPIDRAVWLAKCVGANDIRSVNRKGVHGSIVTGGETRWVREWTTYIEQFVDAVTSDVSHSDWKMRVTYAIRLATSLYTDHLIDKEHFMEWIVSSFETSPQPKLAIWTVFLHIYWKDLFRSRKVGRRLVASLLCHAHNLYSHPDRDVFAQLSSKFRSFLGDMLKASPENFVCPQTWFRYRDSLRSILGIEGEVGSEDTAVAIAFQNANTRNERLSCVTTTDRAQPASRQELIKLLDSNILVPVRPDLPIAIWNQSQDKTMVIKTVLEWATSVYRPGLAKVYVSVRILRAWGKAALVDITTRILEFAMADPLSELERKRLFYHIVSELVRSRDFNVARYLQWIMARGGIPDVMQTKPEGPASIRLLVELPIHAITTTLRVTRGNLLERAAYNVADEAKDLEIATKWLRLALGMPLSENDPHRKIFLAKRPQLSALCNRIELSSRALKTELGVWIRNHVLTAMTQTVESTGLHITMESFRILRSLLEAAHDYSMLADVIQLCLGVSNIDILTSCADTTNLHLPTFAAMGAAQRIFDTMYDRLRSVGQELGTAARPFLASMVQLAQRMPLLEDRAATLERELMAVDRHSSVDASSPISDSMMMQNHEGDLHDEIEKLVANGTSLDRKTMERLFQIVQNRLQTSWYKTDERRRTYASLLAKLRVYDPAHFDSLLGHWLGFVKSLFPRPPIAYLFPLLVSLGCLKLSTLLSTTSDMPGQLKITGPQQEQHQATWLQEILQLVMIPPSLGPTQILTQDECYRYSILQRTVQTCHSKEILTLLRQALIEWANSKPTCDSDPFLLPLDQPETLEQITELIRILALSEPTTHRVLAAKWPQKKLETLVDTLASRLLLPSQKASNKHGFEQVLALANEFTMPFCQLKLSLISHTMDEAQSQNPTEKQQIQIDMFSRAMDKAMLDSPLTNWISMLPCLSPNIANFLKQKAEKQFLDLIPSTRNLHSFPQDAQLADNLLSVIGAIVNGSCFSARTTQLTGAMVDKLADIWEILSTTEVTPYVKSEVLHTWLTRMMQFLSLHVSQLPASQQPQQITEQQQQPQSQQQQAAIEAAKVAAETRGRLCLALAGILKEVDMMIAAVSPPPTPSHMLLTPPSSPLPPPPTFSQWVFDLTIVLADGLTEEVRLHCMRALRNAASDSRLRYAFSHLPNSSEGLMLARRDNPTSQGQMPGGISATWAGTGAQAGEKLNVFNFRKWEVLKEPTYHLGENDSSLSLTLFEAIKYP